MISNSSARWWALAFTLLAIMFSALSAAQVPTSEQLEVLRNLTPEQQLLLQQGASQVDAQPADARQRATMSRSTTAENAGRYASADAMERDVPPPVLRAGDTLVVDLSLPADPATQPSSTGRDQPLRQIQAETVAMQRRHRMINDMPGEDIKKLEALIALTLSRNPYTLDRDGKLTLPGIAPIALGGLSEEEALRRITLEPELLPVVVHISRLPLARTGAAGLQPFGYDLFDSEPTTFSPVTDVPVPADYVVGVGDKFDVQLFGGQNRVLRLTVNRDGAIAVPDLGPIRVGGLTFSAAKSAVESRVSQQMIGVQASVSLTDTRSIRVFVLGEVRQPGSYAVSGLATMTTALFASGGVKPIGSLRDIQLKRQGKVVRNLDLYDLLIKGDTSDDAKLLAGDAIFIPPAGSTVAIDGEVRRPAIYELGEDATIAEAVQMAGGLSTEADTTRVSVTRIDQGGRRVVLDVNLGQPAAAVMPLRNGDMLHIAALRPQLDAGVTVEGFVHRAGPRAWREGLRLTDVIGSVDELKQDADQHYVLIRRESGTDRRISVISADLAAALSQPESAANVPLARRDRIMVFDLAPGRDRVIRPLVEELRLQSDLSRPTELVRIGGSVNVPGEYPLESNMRVSALLRAGGNLSSSAYGSTAELARYVVSDAGVRKTEVLQIDLAALRRGDLNADVLLQPFDNLTVKQATDWGDLGSVTLRGEVRFPGTYPILKGETLRQLLDRAGGLTALASPEGAAFTRIDLQILEQQQLDRLAERMRVDLASLSLQAANAGQVGASEALRSGQALLTMMQGAKATGRLLLDMPGLLAGQVGGEKDVVLRNGDALVVPRQSQVVTVIGEVQSPASHLYLSQLQRNDYIELSGGMSRKADKKRIYVVRADGSTALADGKLLRARGGDASVRPGDTIVIPLNAERMPALPLWQAVTSILYNVAISIAAVNSF
jgi:polysaccharide biosynthesis/export protein